MRAIRPLFVVFLVVFSINAIEFSAPWQTGPAGTAHFIDIPPGPTLYTSGSVDYHIPDSGALLFIVGPRRPLNAEVDTTWEGVAVPHFIKADGVDTVYWEDAFTGVGMDQIPVSDEMGMALVRAEGEGYFSAYVTDFYGEMKSSLPMLFEIIPSGETAEKWGIRGPELIQIGDDMSIFTAAPVDSGGLPVPDYIAGLVIDGIRIRIVGESNPDSSAWVSNVFDRTPAREAILPAVYSLGHFYVGDTEEEVIKIIADRIGDTLPASDTFDVTVLPPGRASVFMPIRFEGLRVTQGVSSSVYGMAFSGSMPDPDNSSTKVRLNPVDLTGTASAVIEPSSWQTLTAGFAGFTLTDTEADTLCVFLVPETDSVPKLNTPIWTPIQVVPPEWAVRLEYDGPSVALTGDTTKLVVEAINGLGEVDTAVDGYFIAPFEGDDNGTVTIIDSVTGEYWDYTEDTTTVLNITNGRCVLMVTDTEAENLYFEARDVELIGLFDQGALGFRWEYGLVFEDGDSGSAVSYEFFRDDMGIYPTGEDIPVTVTARTGFGEIAITYNDSAAVSVSGCAETSPSSGIVHFDCGIASFSVRDDSAETVTLDVSGPLLPDNMSMRFLKPGEGGVLCPLEVPQWIPAGTTRQLRIGIMSFDGIATSYNGVVDITVIDPDSNGSVTYPDTVVITSGIGSIAVRDTDAELFIVRVEARDDSGEMELGVESRGNLMVSMPLSPMVGDLLDSIHFAITDTALVPIAYSCTVGVIIIEGIDNGSVSFDDEVIITDGFGVGVIEDSEAETLQVYVIVPEGQFVYMDAPEAGEWTYYAGEIIYEGTSVDETAKPLKFELGYVIPNPFNPSFSVTVQLPEPGILNLELYDLNGRLVHRLANREYCSGRHNFRFNGRDLPSGVYFTRAIWKDKIVRRKAVLLK